MRERRAGCSSEKVLPTQALPGATAPEKSHDRHRDRTSIARSRRARSKRAPSQSTRSNSAPSSAASVASSPEMAHDEKIDPGAERTTARSNEDLWKLQRSMRTVLRSAPVASASMKAERSNDAPSMDHEASGASSALA